ncbi:MAG: branched-chain amino acid ABC transporter permease [Desulfurococcaceae archaeon]
MELEKGRLAMLGLTREALKSVLPLYALSILMLSFIPLTGNDYLVHLMILAYIYMIVASGLDILVGYTGALNLGQAGFFAIGAYTSTLLSMKANVSPWLGLILGGLLASVLGLVLGIPSLRLRGPYLAISTLGFGVIVYILLINLEEITRGPLGIPGIPALPSIGPLNFANRGIYYYFAMVLSLTCILALKLLSISRFGRVLVAIREDEDAAKAIGVNIAFYRLAAFMVSSFFAGLAGALYAHYVRYINPDLSALGESISILTMTLLGGFGTVVGPAIGAVILILIAELLRPLLEYRFLIYGALIMLIVRFLPGGLYSIIEKYLPTHLGTYLRRGLYGRGVKSR